MSLKASSTVFLVFLYLGPTSSNASGSALIFHPWCGSGDWPYGVSGMEPKLASSKANTFLLSYHSSPGSFPLEPRSLWHIQMAIWCHHPSKSGSPHTSEHHSPLTHSKAFVSRAHVALGQPPRQAPCLSVCPSHHLTHRCSTLGAQGPFEEWADCKLISALWACVDFSETAVSVITAPPCKYI